MPGKLMRHGILLVLLCSRLGAQTPAPGQAGIEAELASAVGGVLDGSGDFPSPDEEGVAKSMERIWQLCASWTAAQLTAHPESTPEELVAAFSKLSKAPLSLSAVRLDSGAKAAYAVAVESTWIGTFFVVARNPDGSFGVPWAIRELAARHYESRDEIGYWAYTGFALGDGPLGGSVRPLPPSRSGNPRFYVVASSHPQMGGTSPAQVSFWEWDGREAKSLWIHSYMRSFDTGEVGELEGDRLRIPIKGDLKTLFSCGSCSEPEAAWSLRITPDGVEDLGVAFAVPELQAVDEVVDRIFHNRATVGIAAPEAEQGLRKILKEQGILSTAEGESPSLAMLGAWHAEARPGGSALELETDALSCTIFEFGKREESPLFLTGVRPCEASEKP